MGKIVNEIDDCNAFPAKIWICKCRFCKDSKAKSKNRGQKQKIKRLMNKRRRTVSNKYVTHYWA